MKASILVVLVALCSLGLTAAQSTTYNLTLTGTRTKASQTACEYMCLGSNDDEKQRLYASHLCLMQCCVLHAIANESVLSILVASGQGNTIKWFFCAAGPANSPPVNDLAVGQAFLVISFNTGSNNITYQLTADNITEVMAGHIHIAPSVGANGSVSIPLYQAPYLNLPGATTTGLLAAAALTPSAFVGPYLEVLPDYNNVAVSDVLSQFVQPGLAYAQVNLCCIVC